MDIEKRLVFTFDICFNGGGHRSFPTAGTTAQVQNVDLITALVITLLGPVSEEMAFRGYAQSIVRRKMSMNSTILISALFFSLFHPF